MNLAELKEAYKARKLALDSAKKEEEKYKALLKDAMLEAGESDYTDEAGYRFERIVQERKSMDEEKLLAELHERNLTSCIATKEVVDEDATLKAVEAGELPQEVLADALKVTEVVMLKLTAPKKAILKQSGKIIFNMQYQNDTELAKGKIFKAQYFRYYEEYKIDYDFQTAKVRVKTEDGIDQWIKVLFCKCKC